jgi:hypothetical protein
MASGQARGGHTLRLAGDPTALPMPRADRQLPRLAIDIRRSLKNM